MASAGGAGRAEIRKGGMGIVERPPEESGRVGSKRIRDHLDGRGSHGLYGVTTSEKKAAIANRVHMISDGTFEMGGHNLHGTYGERTLPDSNTLRSNISSPRENMGNKLKKPTEVCTFYTQGQCSKGNTCTFLHEIKGPDSVPRWNKEEKAGLLSSDVYGNSRGPKEGSQVQRLSSTFTPEISWGVSRMLDGGILQSAAEKSTYLEVNNSYSKHQHQSFDLSIPSDPLQGRRLSIIYSKMDTEKKCSGNC